MDPTTLHFSRQRLLIQLLAFLLFGIACIWILSALQLPQPGYTTAAVTTAANDPTPDILFDELPRQRHQTGLDRLTGGWFSAAILLAGIACAAWACALRIWRLAGSGPALAFRNRQVLVHGSWLGAPDAIAIGRITGIEFDRSDRVSGGAAEGYLKAFSLSGYLGARLGQRLRHTLLIRFEDETGETRSLSVLDIDIDGGREQMGRFAEYLKAAQTAELRRSQLSGSRP